MANPLSRYELFDVQFAVQMDPELFRYTPPEDGARDMTSEIRTRMYEALETASTPPAAEGPRPTRTENAARPTSRPS